MDIIRNFVDDFYDFAKPWIFKLTEKDPEVAHEYFVNLMRLLHFTGLEKIVLDFNSENKNGNQIKISNAAGFNKNGKIPITTLRYLGFDRAVIGTITGESYEGNPRPRIKRFPKTDSFVNWMALPGIGAEEVARVMENYGEHEIPITINFAPTPKTKNIISDLRKSVSITKNLHRVDRFELNISCPNTNEEISGYQTQLKSMLDVVYEEKNDLQKVYLKVSPDLTEKDIDGIIEISLGFPVNGFVTTNTTTEHDSRYINKKLGKGGASGDAVYEKSLGIQKMFYEKLKNSDAEIIPCGGIKNTFRLEERIKFTNSSPKEIQIFTPLIFRGPKLIRELKRFSK